MEHEVFVPFPADTVRQALADPARVSRCIPAFQPDAQDAADAAAPDALVGPVDLTGRLRLRVGNSTITYRGRLRIAEQNGGDLAVEAEGTEARGSGSVKVAMTVRLSAADGGSVLACSGTVGSEGRLADSREATAANAGRRLLDRFAAELASSLESSPLGTGDPGDDNQRVIPGIPSPDKPKNDRAADAASPEAAASEPSSSSQSQSQSQSQPADRASADRQSGDPKSGDQRSGDRKSGDRRPSDAEPAASAEGDRPEKPSVFETDVPPPSLDPLADADGDAMARDEDAAADGSDERPADGRDEALDEGLDGGSGNGLDRELAERLEENLGTEPPAEAAHARRTMIGRSAEEVDHAPPRGRYAPVPAPEATVTSAALRWAAPAAAAVVASAVVIGRILRRRR